jgi:hypothetical protein
MPDNDPVFEPCDNCGHDRRHHDNNRGHCQFRIRISGGNVGCACVRFRSIPSPEPDQPIDEGDWTNPVTLTVAACVAHLNRGDFDPYLELILSTAHQRKLALRGVRGFPRLDEQGGTRAS